MSNFTPNINETAQILQSIVRASFAADQVCGDVQASSDWLTLISAAASHAYQLLTDCKLELQGSDHD